MGRELRAYVLENLQRAMDYHFIQPYYQPVIRTIARQLCSFEALARWIDPELGTIYPDEFIPVLEEAGRIHLLDACIIRQVCARIRRSMDLGEPVVPVSVNLSRLDFELCDIFAVVNDLVTEYQIPHEFIYIEITESIMAEEKDLMSGIVDRFRSAGFQVWMDDFGSAYSSLNVLKEYVFDEVKLDMCFLRPFNERSKRIAIAVIDMAKAIDVHTLVEGVETEEQLRYLLNIGCEKVQGYYFGRPMPYEDALEHLKEKEIGIEPPQDRRYYDAIGGINVLSAVPFMTRAERDAITTARELNSIPLAVLEVREKTFSILFYNTALEKIAQGTGMFFVSFEQSLLRQPLPHRLLSDKLLNLLDSTRSGEEGRMHFTSNEDFYEIRARCFAQTRDRYCALLRMSNLSKASRAQNRGRLDEYLRRIYALYERITLVDLETDTVTPLYIATRERLVSRQAGVQAIAREYAERYIFPDDREAYLRFVDPVEGTKAFLSQGRAWAMRAFRTSVRHGQYIWKGYTVLMVDAHTFLLMISDIHDAMPELHAAEDGGLTPTLLWHNLMQSGLARIFWKDRDRRFLGASSAFLDYYGFDSVDEIVGKTDEDLGWHIHPDKYMSDEERVLGEGVTLHNVPGLCMNRGENREILASKAPIYGEDGEIEGLMGFFLDRKLLAANDARGEETKRRDIVTGLLNSRGISEEATRFRDEYYLRGADFARIHVGIENFSGLNEHYGFDFGDKVLSALGQAFHRAFGHSCVVGRYSGHKFVMLYQVKDRDQAHDLRARIREVASSVTAVDGTPVTLYLSVGYVLFSEFLDLEEQAKKAEVRLLADHDQSLPAESRLSHASDMFHLFDDLPVGYAVYHVTAGQGDDCDAVFFYVNHAFEALCGAHAAQLVGHGVRQRFPAMDERWYADIRRAAMDAERAEGVASIAADGRRCRYTATQIIYPGYCAVTYQAEG